MKTYTTDHLFLHLSMHYFSGRSKRELSCLEIRSSSRFLREIWISYFARRNLEGVFVRGIVNIRNECLFFSVHGKWIAVRNKQIAREPLRGSRDLFVPHCDSFPMNREKRHSFLKYQAICSVWLWRRSYGTLDRRTERQTGQNTFSSK